MKPKTKLLKLIKQFSEEERRVIVLDPYGNRPMSLNIIYLEVNCDTKLGKKLLKRLLK